MPISRDRFESIDSDENERLPDLSPDTTQGKIYRFLLANRGKAFRQREIIEQIDIPEGSVGPTLKRLEEQELIEHRDRFWSISDAEHASASAVALSAAAADARDGGFTDEERQEWMEHAVNPIDEED